MTNEGGIKQNNRYSDFVLDKNKNKVCWIKMKKGQTENHGWCAKIYIKIVNWETGSTLTHFVNSDSSAYLPEI